MLEHGQLTMLIAGHRALGATSYVFWFAVEPGKRLVAPDLASIMTDRSPPAHRSIISTGWLGIMQGMALNNLACKLEAGANLGGKAPATGGESESNLSALCHLHIIPGVLRSVIRIAETSSPHTKIQIFKTVDQSIYGSDTKQYVNQAKWSMKRQENQIKIT